MHKQILTVWRRGLTKRGVMFFVRRLIFLFFWIVTMFKDVLFYSDFLNT